MRDAADVEPQRIGAVDLDQWRPALRPSAPAARPVRHRPPDRPAPRSAPDRARAHRSAARPARAPRAAAAGVTAWITGPCVPSTVRTIAPQARFRRSAWPSARSPVRQPDRQDLSLRPSCVMVHRPGGCPRARNSSASHAGAPGARGSNGLGSDGALAIRQRIRAPLRLASPPSRTSQAGTPNRSAATASRRVAVKSRPPGRPTIRRSRPTAPAHLKPSSIAHRAARASRASTWMSSDPQGRPGG